jgi:hypothetical protein
MKLFNFFYHFYYVYVVTRSLTQSYLSLHSILGSVKNNNSVEIGCLFIFTFYLVLRQTLTESLHLIFIETFLYLNNV